MTQKNEILDYIDRKGSITSCGEIQTETIEIVTLESYWKGYAEGKKSWKKEGRWVYDYELYRFVCSNCKEEPIGFCTKFCPHCGAEMMEADEDE